MSIIMKNLLEKLFIILSFLVVSMPIYGQNKHKNFVLVLDAGHGGHDSGTRGIFDLEKNIALDITLELGKMIENHFKDVKVIYTRKDDTFVTLNGRADIANKNHADFFISIHCNAARPTAYGTETFVLGTEEHRSSSNLNVVKQENSVILLEEGHKETYAGFDPHKPESIIGLTLMQNNHLSNSLLFAQAVEDNFTSKDKRNSRGVKQAGFVVLWRTATPSVLIETGFISNPEEGAFLASKEGKIQTAESIFNAFKLYKSEWDKRRKNEASEHETAKKANENAEKPVENKVFKIQFLTNRRKYNSNAPQLKGLKPTEIMNEGNLYIYLYGKTSYLSKRDELLNYVRKKGFPDAFVVEFPIEKENKKNALVDKKNGFSIQFLSSDYKYKDNSLQLKGLSPVERIYENNSYKYFYGWYSSKQEATQNLSKVRGYGFQDAFVVKFVNGHKE